ncbi:MAG: hypothetical protein A2W91_09430 [Bacteroidetes bacterium GWF2_38_335]|nr:MAG: hypothetical protein A2W91_09430 [Bacteroidetes bacterium GWF2_38_335]OFY80811.1 MAG: hypothetical protein A2281_09070 [Bacteroidetes bacterium RIFOXYA12_FULL_38_20]HBS86211.1 hypothetical protein [Bacteroidales bacterium]
MKWSVVFCILAWLMPVYQVSAQKYHFINYTVQNGFPQSNADHVFQDSQGFMWFATQNGAVKFDGHNYQVINEKDGLPSSVVQHINQDSEGNFWISTKSGLTKIDKNGKIKTFTEKDGFSSPEIICTYEINPGKMLVCTRKSAAIISGEKVIKISPDVHVRFFLKMKSGQIWAATAGGINILNGNFLEPLKSGLSEFQLSFSDMAEVGDSLIWFSTSHGIYKYNGRKFELFTENEGLISNKINCLLYDSEGYLWYSSENKGCGRYKNGVFQNFTPENGITSLSVLSLFEDREKNIWMGSRNGVSMLNVHSPFVHFDKVSPAEGEIVLGIKGDESGNIWFCTYGHGLVKYDGTTYETLDTKKGSIEDYFFDVEIDRKTVWLASANNGIIKYDGKNFTRINKIGEKRLERVYNIFKDSYGNIWFGGNYKGVVKYDGENFTVYNPENGFEGGDVMGIGEDPAKNMWFSSTSSGLYMYNGKKFISFGEMGMDNNYIRCVAYCNDVMWCGTASEGIIGVSEKNGKFSWKYVNTDLGISSNNVYILYPDSRGNLWCGTEKGIDRISFDKNGSDILVKNYTKDEGFYGVETNINGAFEDRKGNIWFGTVDGATCYFPERDAPSMLETNTYITRLRLFFEDFNWKEYCSSVDDGGLPVDLVLPWDMNHLTFDFIGLCYSNPDKVKYRYRLLGQSDIWSPPTSDPKAVFTNITPGKYEFQVISSNSDGVWNENPVTLKFTIEPPYWQKLWFILLVSGAVLSFVILIVNLRIRALKAAKKVLEMKVINRTQEIQHQKEEIEAQRNNTEEQKKIIERIHREVDQSIVYATRIQQSVFPDINILKNHFSDQFVFFRPKDQVSGDFYWWTTIENQTIITAVDCTGHGVPGAFMSMLGISFLREIVMKEYITHPGVILRKLRKEIIKSLNQTNEIGTQRDGMDMGLISINHETNVMQFSGANNPVYIITRNRVIQNSDKVITTGTHEMFLHEIKGDKMPISIHYRMDKFDTHEIQLQKGDQVYLFSDGFADQFGGANAGKFRFKPFKELLLKNAHLPMEEQQKVLENAFDNWKGILEQVDDVVVVGVKV